MRICDINGCGKKHEARGYCKSHYKSLLKYGNPLQVDENRTLNAHKREIKEAAHRKNLSREGECSIDGCTNPIKARKLCEMHYARRLRTGSLKRKTRSMSHIPDKCLVIDCENEYFSMGYCSTHRSYDLKYGSPYLPKIIKLCGVVDCLEDHWGRGLCIEHFKEWKKELRFYKIEEIKK